mmetsp:Transcript_62953/g.111822  ORF Transcript_62953/g.111822 Transcript_62953/m.111822 type:complete len:89 (-) Transcript_62953:218-484(-)
MPSPFASKQLNIWSTINLSLHALSAPGLTSSSAADDLDGRLLEVCELMPDAREQDLVLSAVLAVLASEMFRPNGKQSKALMSLSLSPR